MPDEAEIKYYSHPRHRQDRWVINDVFKGKRNGYFIDAGAGRDGIINSNSYALESQFGWTGLLAEPHPDLFPAVKKNRKAPVEKCCLTDRRCDVDFTLNTYAPGTSGIADGISEPNLASDGYLTHDFETTKIPGFPLWELLREHNAPSVIDYLSLDIEGAEWNALKDFPFDEYRILCMSIERNGKDYYRLAALLRRSGYRLARVQGPDDFYYHSSIDYRPSIQERVKANIKSVLNATYAHEPMLTARRIARTIKPWIRGG